jgi:response regulator NasT
MGKSQGVIISANASSKPLDSGHRHTDVDECQEEVDDLRTALETRPVIDQAKGILIGQHHCTPDEAFAMLADASQRSNRKLRDVAQAIVQAESDIDE